MKKDNIVIKNQEEVIRQDNRKAVKVFAGIMAASVIFGAITGFLIAMAGDSIANIPELFRKFSADNARIIYILFSIILLILTAAEAIGCIQSIRKSREKITGFMEDDEEEDFVLIGKYLSTHILITNIIIILHFICFSVNIFLFMGHMKTDSDIGFLLLGILVLIIGAAVMILLQQKLVDCIRLLNPEKKGSVYDIGFYKKWEESSDEAELFWSYKAAYKSFRAVNTACIILWIFFVLQGMITGTGFFSALTALIIWAVSIVVYSYHIMKRSVNNF